MKNSYLGRMGKVLATGLASVVIAYSPLGAAESDYGSEFGNRPMDSYECFKIKRDDIVRIRGNDDAPRRSVHIRTGFQDPENPGDLLVRVDDSMLLKATDICFQSSVQYGPNPEQKRRSTREYQSFTPNYRPGVLDPDFPEGANPAETKHKAFIIYKSSPADKRFLGDLEENLGDLTEITAADIHGQREMTIGRPSRKTIVSASYTLATDLVAQIQYARKRIGKASLDPNSPADPNEVIRIQPTGTVVGEVGNDTEEPCFKYLAYDGCTDPDGLEGPLGIGDGQISNSTAIVNKNGKLYINDNDNAEGVVKSSSGDYLGSFIFTPGSLEHEMTLGESYGMDVSDDGSRIIFSDFVNGKLLELSTNNYGPVDPNDIVNVVSGINGPRGIDIDPNGNTWVAARDSKTIERFDSSLNNTGSFSFDYPGEAGPSSVAVDLDRNRLYVTNESDKVRILNMNTGDLEGILESVEEPFSSAAAVSVEPSVGNVMFQDGGSRGIFYVFDRFGNQLLATGGKSIALGLFQGVATATTNEEGNIVTGDSGSPALTILNRGEDLDPVDPNTP